MNKLHKFEEKMRSTFSAALSKAKVSNLPELNEAVLMKLNKNQLVNTILSLVNVFDENVGICRSAAGKIDELKSEQILLQRKHLETQSDQLETVKSTVKSELNIGLQGWADVVKKNTTQLQSNVLTTTKKSVKQVIEKVNEEERRSCNLMIYGLPESDGEIIGTKVDTVYHSMNNSIPTTIDCYRVGKQQEGKTRPIRLECQNRCDVEFALVHSKRLRDSAKHSQVYLAPDRSKEQRQEHSLLVKKMKDLICKDPTKRYFIRNNKVCSAATDKV